MNQQLQAVKAPQAMTIEHMEALSDRIAKSNMIPKAFQGNPSNCLIAMMMGQEIGISPMQAIQNIAVVNGTPKIWGDMTLAIVMGHPDYKNIKTGWDEKNLTAYCTIERRGHEPHTVRFSMEDAKRMGLAGKETYKADPVRMCTWRAKQRAISDMFPDSLKGMAVVSADIEPEEILMGAVVLEQPTVERVIQLINDATTRDELDGAAAIAKQLPEADRQKKVLRDAFTLKAKSLAQVDEDGLTREPVTE